MKINEIEFNEEKRNDLIFYTWTWEWVWATILYRNGSDFYTTALVTKKEWGQLEQVSHKWTTLSECVQILQKMKEVALSYNVPEWKEY